jgi:hypothetical protein
LIILMDREPPSATPAPLQGLDGRSSDQSSDPRTPTAVRPFVMNQEVREHPSYDSLDDRFNCLVCFEPFLKGHQLYELPCGHRYHKECVRPWVRQKRQCPKCLSVLPLTPTAPPPATAAEGSGFSAARANTRSMTNVPRSHWVRDELVSYCTRCRAEFGFFRRKHHCRCCGRIFCSSCCPREGPPVPFGDGFRSCSDCKDPSD